MPVRRFWLPSLLPSIFCSVIRWTNWVSGRTEAPQCLHFIAWGKINSAHYVQRTCVSSAGGISVERMLLFVVTASKMRASRGLMMQANRNQPKTLRPLLEAKIPIAMASPNQKNISPSIILTTLRCADVCKRSWCGYLKPQELLRKP